MNLDHYPWTQLLGGDLTGVLPNPSVRWDSGDAYIAAQSFTINRPRLTGVVGGSYGSASAIPVVTVDQYGTITNITTATPTAVDPLDILFWKRSYTTDLTGVVPGTYGSSTLVPIITVDSQGRLKTVTTGTISAGEAAANTRMRTTLFVR